MNTKVLSNWLGSHQYWVGDDILQNDHEDDMTTSESKSLHFHFDWLYSMNNQRKCLLNGEYL